MEGIKIISPELAEERLRESLGLGSDVTVQCNDLLLGTEDSPPRWVLVVCPAVEGLGTFCVFCDRTVVPA